MCQKCEKSQSRQCGARSVKRRETIARQMRNVAIERADQKWPKWRPSRQLSLRQVNFSLETGKYDNYERQSVSERHQRRISIGQALICHH